MNEDFLKFHDENNRFLETEILKLERLKRVLMVDHPDSVILTEAYEAMSRQAIDVKL